MFEPVPPNYYISDISERWLHSEHLILPGKFPAPTQLLEVRPLPLSAIHKKELEAICSSTIDNFNKIQTQVFQALYATDDVLVGASTGSGKTMRGVRIAAPVVKA